MLGTVSSHSLVSDIDPDPTVLVVVLNYDSTDLTRACVESLLIHTDPRLDFHIRIVDNASSSSSREALCRWLETRPADPRLSLRLNAYNRGFGRGMSDGLEGFTPRYVFFLNSDVVVETDVLTAFVRFFEAHRSVGLAGPAQSDMSGRLRSGWGTLPSIAELVFGRSLGRLWHGAPRPPWADGRPLAGPVEKVSGAALFLRTCAFREIGGFDPDLFLYAEEEDLCWRMWKRGWEVWYVPEITIRHAGGGSSHHRAELTRLFYSSYLYVIRKHRGTLYERLYRALLLVKLLRRVVQGRASLALLRSVAKGPARPETRGIPQVEEGKPD